MRVYVPGTSTTLRLLLAERALTAMPFTAFAVTPGLRESYSDGDSEELEYVAMSEAARASLRLIDADATAARRRVVIACEIPDADVTVCDYLDGGVVRIASPIPIGAIASVHVDDAEAEATVAAGAAAIIEADLGAASAQDAVDDVEGFELAWYATQEIESWLAELG